MLDSMFAALADPTRRAILAHLANGELSVGEVVECFGISQSGISRHLNVLENAQLIERRREGQRRICRLTPGPLSEVDDWMALYRDGWSSSLKRLDAAISGRTDP